MDINGNYKISIEMTARVQYIFGEVERRLSPFAEIERLQSHVGAEMRQPAEMEARLQSMIERCKANQAFDSLEMTITDRSISVRNSEGECVYDIKSRTEKSDDRVVLHLHSEEMRELTWDVRFSEGTLLVESGGPLSDCVFERKR